MVDALEGVESRVGGAAPAGADLGEPLRKARRRGGLGRAAAGAAAAAAAKAAAVAAPQPPAQPAQQPQRQKTGVCFAFNAGKCTGLDQPCPQHFVHVCVICGERHMASKVPGCREQVDAGGYPVGMGKRGKRKGGGGGAPWRQ